MMEKYQYSPLKSPREIRLLKLHAGAEADELYGELVHTSLDTTPNYTALSYVWGDPQPRKAVYCSGLELEIGPSLHSALQHLREPAREMLLWADAVCINQEDILERGQQVRMMGDIYAGASATAIWLGEESDEIKTAFDWLCKFSVASDFLKYNLNASDKPDFISRDWAEKTVQIAFGEHRVSAFQHIGAVLDHPWFTRKWIIQELVKSNTPIMVAGRIRFPWTLLTNWVLFVEQCPKVKEHFVQFCSNILEPGAKTLAMSILRATLLTQLAVPERPVLLFLIVNTLEFRCTDPRDHVFAMLGIASDADQFDLVDYGSSMEQVCRKLAYACVSDSMKLRLLWSLVYLTPLKRRIRSWLPNIESVLANRDGSVLATQFKGQQHRDHDASGDTVLQTQLDLSGNMLTIRGRIIDRVKLLGRESRHLGDTRIIKLIINKENEPPHIVIQKIQRQRYQWLEECFAIAKTTHITNEEDSFLDAVLSDVDKEEDQNLQVVRSEFSIQRRLLKTMACEDMPRPWLTALRASTSLESTFLLFLLLGRKFHRRFGSTEDDRIGWLPPVAKEGDFICVFDGMELPYAIRPSADGRYHLIGECLIPGIMMGEAVDSSRAVPVMIVLE